jgi:hypothetical protein
MTDSEVDEQHNVELDNALELSESVKTPEKEQPKPFLFWTGPSTISDNAK